MLSLFKLPFWKKNLNQQDCFPADEIAQGIFRNYHHLSRKNKGSGEVGNEARKCLNSEFDSLHKLLRGKPEEDQYELIRKSLQRIDEQLGDL